MPACGVDLRESMRALDNQAERRGRIDLRIDQAGCGPSFPGATSHGKGQRGDFHTNTKHALTEFDIVDALNENIGETLRLMPSFS